MSKFLILPKMMHHTYGHTQQLLSHLTHHLHLRDTVATVNMLVSSGEV